MMMVCADWAFQPQDLAVAAQDAHQSSSDLIDTCFSVFHVNQFLALTA